MARYGGTNETSPPLAVDRREIVFSMLCAFKAPSALAPRGCKIGFAPPGRRRARNFASPMVLPSMEQMFLFLPRARVSGAMAPFAGESENLPPLGAAKRTAVGTLRPCGVWRSAVLLGWSRRVRSRGPLPDVPHCCCGCRAWSGVELSPFSCAPLVPRAMAF